VRFGSLLAVPPGVAYLALNYVDRYLSKRYFPVGPRPMGLSSDEIWCETLV
jgi:hypothetical protein